MDPVAAAKAVVSAHEALARAGDLDGILGNIDDDVVLLAADAPLIVGKAAFRKFYGSLLAMGRWEFVHDYVGAGTVGDLVLLHGVARGRLTPPGGEPSRFANNFVHVWRRQADGTYRGWRLAFAPAGQSDEP